MRCTGGSNKDSTLRLMGRARLELDTRDINKQNIHLLLPLLSPLPPSHLPSLRVTCIKLWEWGIYHGWKWRPYRENVLVDLCKYLLCYRRVPCKVLWEKMVGVDRLVCFSNLIWPCQSETQQTAKLHIGLPPPRTTFCCGELWALSCVCIIGNCISVLRIIRPARNNKKKFTKCSPRVNILSDRELSRASRENIFSSFNVKSS